MPEPVTVVDYDPSWPATFNTLRGGLARTLETLPVVIEHIGSTSIFGAAAKPIIDIDVVVGSDRAAAEAIRLLSKAGYGHKGDQGVPGREAFDNPPGLPAHHLYVVVSGNAEHRRQLLFGDYLRTHPEATRRCSELKKSLAIRFRNDRAGYTDAKTGFVESILRKASRKPL